MGGGDRLNIGLAFVSAALRRGKNWKRERVTVKKRRRKRGEGEKIDLLVSPSEPMGSACRRRFDSVEVPSWFYLRFLYLYHNNPGEIPGKSNEVPPYFVGSSQRSTFL